MQLFLTLKPEERYFFRNTQLFHSFDVVGTHVTQGGSNFHSCVVTDIKKLHKEINKHIILTASTNQVVS